MFPMINWDRAFMGGFLGVFAMTITMGALDALGMGHGLELPLGAIFSDAAPLSQWMLGAVIQLLIAMPVAALYALVFERVAGASGALVGGTLGVPHGILNAVLLQFFGGVTSGHAGALRGGLNDAVSVVLGTVVFGAVVGFCYGEIIGRRNVSIAGAT